MQQAGIKRFFSQSAVAPKSSGGTATPQVQPCAAAEKPAKRSRAATDENNSNGNVGHNPQVWKPSANFLMVLLNESCGSNT